jgi:hypothetical protein
MYENLPAKQLSLDAWLTDLMVDSNIPEPQLYRSWKKRGIVFSEQRRLLNIFCK